MFLMFLMSALLADFLPLSDRYFHQEDIGHDYGRGTYLIILADESLEAILRDESTGDFIQFKQTQGYDVELVVFSDVGGTADNLRLYLEYYNTSNPLLEYVLLIGDYNPNSNVYLDFL